MFIYIGYWTLNIYYYYLLLLWFVQQQTYTNESSGHEIIVFDSCSFMHLVARKFVQWDRTHEVVEFILILL